MAQAEIDVAGRATPYYSSRVVASPSVVQASQLLNNAAGAARASFVAAPQQAAGVRQPRVQKVGTTAIHNSPTAAPTVPVLVPTVAATTVDARAPLTSPRVPSPNKAMSQMRRVQGRVQAATRSRRGASVEPVHRTPGKAERSSSTGVRPAPSQQQQVQQQQPMVHSLPHVVVRVLPKSTTGSNSASALPTATSFEGNAPKQVEEPSPPRLTRHDSATATSFAPALEINPAGTQCAGGIVERVVRLAENGSATVPSPPAPLQLVGPSRARSVVVSSVNGVGRVNGSAVIVEPEAEPAAHAGSFVDNSIAATLVQPRMQPIPKILSEDDRGLLSSLPIQGIDEEEDILAPEVTLQSAKIAALTEESLQLHVRLPPSEIVHWDELQIVQGISTGSFGEVFLANYDGREVSVKRCILGDDGSMTEEQLRNLEREINTYRTLDHPCIVKYIGCVLENPNLAILTEYLPNGNVFDLLYTHRVSLQAAYRLKIASQVALALCYMHSCDPILIHRDLKTQNLVLDAEYNAKLCDFGKTISLDNTAVVLQQDKGGSPRYTAPECFQPTAYVTEKVDIWSLGCCLIEVFGGPLPYEDIPQMAHVLHVMQTQREPPMVPSWFVPRVRPILARCFDFSPQSRPAVFEVQLVLKRMTAEEMERHGMNVRRTH
mmetsp:Transcript_9763/g.17622  ORF Transcript_9763/g.17622 Transcript_9763/m.17622 type:complete len:660 (+) Transcript_9763:59-2038(+)